MTQLQDITTCAVADRARYLPLLGKRIILGREYADLVSHLQEETIEGVRLFQRLLDVDAALSSFREYDDDLFRVVIREEEVRMHLPPDVPSDDHLSPCLLCLRQGLNLNLDVVLGVQARGTR